MQSLKKYVDKKERDYLVYALRNLDGNVSEVCRLLDIERCTYYVKAEKHNISAKDYKKGKSVAGKSKKSARTLSINELNNMVAHIYKTLDLPKNHESRERVYAIPRFLIICLLRFEYDVRPFRIAEVFNINHSSVNNAIRKMSMWIAKEMYGYKDTYGLIKLTAETYQKKLSNN